MDGDVATLRALLWKVTRERDDLQRTLALVLASAPGGCVEVPDQMEVAYSGATITSWRDPGRGVMVLRGSVRYGR